MTAFAPATAKLFGPGIDNMSKEVTSGAARRVAMVLYKRKRARMINSDGEIELAFRRLHLGQPECAMALQVAPSGSLDYGVSLDGRLLSSWRFCIEPGP